MEALVLTSALLALAHYFIKRKSKEDDTSAPDDDATPPAIVRNPPPATPPLPPPSGRPPAGVSDQARLERAHGLAVQVAQTIKAQGPAYGRNVVARFQREAGLEPDGIYGPRTAGAVKWYTQESISPLSGRGFQTYAPFGTVNVAASRSFAIKPASSPLAAPTQKQPGTPQGGPGQKPPATPQGAPSQKQPAATQAAPARKPATPPAVGPGPKPGAPAPTAVSPQKPAASSSSASKPPAPPAVVPGLPDRAELDQIAALARQVGESVKKLGKSYDRALVTRFQRAAGLVTDGVYGPRTAGSVKWFTEESIPPPEGGALVPYVPKFASAPKAEPPSAPKVDPPQAAPNVETPKPLPTTPQVKTPAAVPTVTVNDRARLDRAAGLAMQVAQNLKEPASAYNRELVRKFQQEAGLAVDGTYGPKTAGAVKWYTNESITPKSGRGFVQYVPKF